MYRFTLVFLLLVSFAGAQTKPAAGKKPAAKKPTKQELARLDSLKKDSLKQVELDAKVPNEFTVYTKKARTKAERTKLCINLVHKGQVLNYCMNDSLCRDPEVYKTLFEQQNGDSLYVLVYIDAFTKIDASNDDGRCGAGKETKLVFARWNLKTNQAKWKQKNIASCLKGITNMSKTPVDEWDKASPLILNYHRAANFYEVKFDPQQYQLGFQSNNDNESK